MKITPEQSSAIEMTHEQESELREAWREAKRILEKVDDVRQAQLAMVLKQMHAGDMRAAAESAIMIGLALAAVAGPSLLSVTVMCKLLERIQEDDPGYFRELRTMVGLTVPEASA